MEENRYRQARIGFIVVGVLNSIVFLMGFPLEAWDVATLTEFCWPICAAIGCFIAAWAGKTGKTWQFVSGLAVIGLAIAIREYGRM